MDGVPRFLRISDVAEILNISASQAQALVRRGELLGIQIGGRGQWRVERSELERYIEHRYAEARRRAEQLPVSADVPLDGEFD